MGDDVYISLFDSIPTWVMLVPIFICSILALAVIVERVIFYMKINLDYRLIVKNCMEYVRSGRLPDARILCRQYQGPIMDLVEQGVEASASEKMDALSITDMSERSIKKIERYMGLMSTIATVSPMFGLFGTVTGMMKSFSALTKVGQFAHDMLARGIAEALVTTALGLLVAIPSWIFYNYMVSRVEHFIKEVEFVAGSLSEIGK